MMHFKNLRKFLEHLDQLGEVTHVRAQVDPKFELAEIHRRVIENNGKVLWFHAVKGSPFPVVTNLFGTMHRLDIAFGNRPEKFIQGAANLVHRGLAPSLQTLWDSRHLAKDLWSLGLKTKQRGPVYANRVPLEPDQGLRLLPALTQWPLDGGPFVTLPLVYTENPNTGKHNLGMYRIQIYDEKTTGMHWQIHKGGGFHYYEAQKMNQPLPVTLYIGGPPALMLSAIAPLPEDVPELLLCSLLMGEKLDRVAVPNHPHKLICEADFAICGEVPPHERRLEGPFGDHYGYYSLAHDYPVFNVKQMYHRPDAIYPATIVGKPRQEDFYIGQYLQKLLSPLFPIVMPSVLELHTFGETGFHALGAARVKDRYSREAMGTALRILGEGQLSLQKFIMVTDGNVEISDFKSLLSHFLARTQWEKDLFVISNVSQDTLDYTGPKVNEGSKGIWLALGEPVRELHGDLPTSLPTCVLKAQVFVPGLLVIQTLSYEQEPHLVKEILDHPGLSPYQVVLVVDDVQECCSNTEKLLWTWFTRFEPAADIYGARTFLNRFHVGLNPPVFFDARMKPWYPGTVEADPSIVQLVNKRWKEYFPDANPW